VPRQVSFWPAYRKFDQRDTTFDEQLGWEEVREEFIDSLYNIDFLPTGSYTVTTSKGFGWNQRYGYTSYTDRWWWTMPTGRMRSGWRYGQNASNQDPGIMPFLQPPWGKANTIQSVILPYVPGSSLASKQVTLVVETNVRLRHTSVYGRQERGIRVSVTAVEMQLSCTGVWEPGPSIPPRQISVRGRVLDENGQAIITLPAGDHDVTPVVSQVYPYYTFTFDAVPTRDHHRTRSYHPYFSTMGGDPGVPNGGRINLFSDPDASVNDADPRLITAGWNETDAVPVGAECLFTITLIQYLYRLSKAFPILTILISKD
jgi:hypothetical protein